MENTKIIKIIIGLVIVFSLVSFIGSRLNELDADKPVFRPESKVGY